MVVLLAMTLVVVVAFAAPFRPALALVSKEELFCFQLKLVDLLTDRFEALLRVVVVEGCHVGEGVGQAKVLNRGGIGPLLRERQRRLTDCA